MPHPGDRPLTVAIVVDDGADEVVVEIDAQRLDLGLVDALARLQLEARRRGWTVRVRDGTGALRGLLELVGLAEVLAVEAGGQAELLEQLGVDEVVQPADPPA